MKLEARHTLHGPTKGHDDRNHVTPRGSEFEVDDETGERLVQIGAARDPEAKGRKAPDADDRQVRIIAAITDLDPENPDHYDKSGKPKVGAVAEILGEKVTAAEMKAALAEML